MPLIRRLILRLHRYMQHHCPWWVYTDREVAGIEAYHRQREGLLSLREVARAQMDTARKEVDRWSSEVRFWKEALAKAQTELSNLVAQEDRTAHG